MTIAPIQKRILAYLIDLSFFLILLIPSYLIITTEHTTFTGQTGTGEFHSVTIPSYLFLKVISFWVLFITLTGFKNGQSFGKRFLKIKVVLQDLTKPSILNIFFRHLFDIVDLALFVGIIIALKNKKNQRIGDFVAKTIVTTI